MSVTVSLLTSPVLRCTLEHLMLKLMTCLYKTQDRTKDYVINEGSMRFTPYIITAIALHIAFWMLIPEAEPHINKIENKKRTQNL